MNYCDNSTKPEDSFNWIFAWKCHSKGGVWCPVFTLVYLSTLAELFVNGGHEADVKIKSCLLKHLSFTTTRCIVG